MNSEVFVYNHTLEQKRSALLSLISPHCQNIGFKISQQDKKPIIDVDCSSNIEESSTLISDVEKLLRYTQFKKITPRQYHSGRISLHIGKRMDSPVYYFRFDVQ